MQKVSQGLHGINKKLPELTLKRDLLSFSLQVGSIFICMFSAFLWVVFGFDSTVDGAIRTINGTMPIEMGNGTHFSTILNFFLIAFLISNYLSNREIKGFHNVLFSIFTPIVGMMAFEFVWVFLNDVFHQIPVEGYFANSMFGLGTIDLGMFILGLILIPTSVFYFAFRLSDKINVKPRVCVKIAWLSFTLSVAAIFFFSLIYGTPTILIRNTFALFFVAFADAVFIDATRNWSVHELIGKYKTSIRSSAITLAFLVAVVVLALWVFWPGAEVVKGSAMFPQTVYAFYHAGHSAPEILYVQNDMVHLFNVLAKALVSAAATLVMVPKIEVLKK